MRRPSSLSRSGGIRPRRALALAELLVGVALLSLLTGIAVNLFSGVSTVADSAKLEKDARTLNMAVAAYLNSGGTIPANATADAVLAKLKVRPDTSSLKTLPGLRSSAVDLRLKGKPISADVSGKRRITWDGSKRSFRVKESGAGWTEVFFDETEGSREHGTESRSLALAFASTAPWVWDYQDHLTSVSAPTRRPMTSPAVGQPALTEDFSDLQPPSITPASGEYAYNSFPLGVDIQNPNTIGISVIRYQVDGGDWATWTGGPLALTKDLTHNVRAFAESLDGETREQSVVVDRNYVSYFVRGQAGVAFVNPAGESSRLMHSIASGGRKLEWGKVESLGQTQSSLEFIPSPQFEAGPGETFSVATLRYTNGVSRAKTNVNAVTVAISFPLTVPSQSGISVDMPVRMQNSIHYPWTPAADYKDFVWIPATLAVTQPVVILDRSYRLTLHMTAPSSTPDGADLKIPVNENASVDVTVTATLDRI